VAVITEDEYKLLKANVDRKLARGKVITQVKAAQVKKSVEAELMGRVMLYCKQEGFPCQCFRASRKAKGFLVPGWPD